MESPTSTFHLEERRKKRKKKEDQTASVRQQGGLADHRGTTPGRCKKGVQCGRLPRGENLKQGGEKGGPLSIVDSKKEEEEEEAPKKGREKGGCRD